MLATVRNGVGRRVDRLRWDRHAVEGLEVLGLIGQAGAGLLLAHRVRHVDGRGPGGHALVLLAAVQVLPFTGPDGDDQGEVLLHRRAPQRQGHALGLQVGVVSFEDQRDAPGYGADRLERIGACRGLADQQRRRGAPGASLGERVGGVGDPPRDVERTGALGRDQREARGGAREDVFCRRRQPGRAIGDGGCPSGDEDERVRGVVVGTHTADRRNRGRPRG